LSPTFASSPTFPSDHIPVIYSLNISSSPTVSKHPSHQKKLRRVTFWRRTGETFWNVLATRSGYVLLVDSCTRNWHVPVTRSGDTSRDVLGTCRLRRSDHTSQHVSDTYCSNVLTRGSFSISGHVTGTFRRLPHYTTIFLHSNF
jgi:hypothetical protein